MPFAVHIDREHRVVRLRNSPEWLPEKYRDRPERIRIKFRPTEGERRVLRRHKWEPPSVWAPKHRTVTYGPLEGAKWDNEFMPHMVGIMDASFHPSVREIGNIKAPQGGSSAGLDTLIGFSSDMRPGPALIVYPDKDTSGRRNTDYMQPMFRRSPRLSRLMTGADDDMASFRVKLQTMLIYMGWAGSVTSMSNVSAMYLVVDELDKMAKAAGKKEGSLRDYLRQRVNAYLFTSKIWWSSTPTDPEGHISQYETTEAQVVFEFWVCCPDCGHEQLMDFDGIMRSFPKELTEPKEMERLHAAGYVCSGCGSIWDDRKRKQALIAAMHTGWRAKDDGRRLFDYLSQENPEKICFRSPSWIYPHVPSWKIAASWLRGRKDKDDMKIFVTQHKAEAFVEYRQERKEDRILALRDTRPEGLVPGGGQVAALVAGVDTQDYSFIYYIMAVGWGLTQDCWQVKAGEVLTFEALEQVLFGAEYKDADGVVYPVHVAVQDSQGHRTSEVYDFSALWPGRVIPYNGQRKKSTPVTWSLQEFYPGTNKKIPGGVRLLNVDTTFFKNALARKLNVSPTDPGAWHLHSEATEEYAQHMCAEYRDDQGIWQCRKSSPNHYLDCSLMATVAAYILNIKDWARPEQSVARPAENVPVVNPFTGGRNLFG